MAVQHSALLLAEGSSLNSGQGVLQDLAARAEITCKLVTLDLSVDCFVFHRSSFTILRGGCFIFLSLATLSSSVLVIPLFLLELCLIPKFVKFELPDCSCLC